jgi:hypothetical protein
MELRLTTATHQTAIRWASLANPLILILVLVLVSSGHDGVRAASVSFSPPAIYDQPVNDDLTAADIDGDGRMDLAVVGGGRVSVLYGRGDGTFEPAMASSVGEGLAQVLAADVNGDGLLDLVIADDGTNSVDVLTNQGHRAFSPPVRYPVGTKPYGVTANDFNGDGKPDLAVANDDSHNVCVLLNQGHGTFGAAVFYSAGSFPGRILSIDLNGDSKYDLAVTNYVSGNVIIYFGDGRGRFATGGNYRTGGEYPSALAADDFNGDGKLDLAISNTYGASIALLVGDGKGKFDAPITYPAGPLPFVLASADLDGDGDQDLVTPHSNGSFVTVLENSGEGRLLPAVDFVSGGTNTRTLAVGDFNGDGRPDIAAGNESSNTVSIFLNTTSRPTPAIRTLVVDPPVVIGTCQEATGTVILTAPAPVGGAAVTLFSNNLAVTVPPLVTVPEGATSIHFSPILSPVTTPATGSITASLQGSARRVPITIRPGNSGLVKLDTPSVIGGQPVGGEVALPCPITTDALLVTFTSSHTTLVPVPASVVALRGALSVAFSITTRPVLAHTPVTITAIFAGTARTTVLELKPVPPLPPLPPPSTAPNLLVNGGFEEPDTWSSPVGSLTFGAAGIPGWKITRGTVDVTAWFWQAKEGRQSLDLVGDAHGVIEQSFATEVGRDYLLTGWIAHNPTNPYLAKGRGEVYVDGIYYIPLLHKDGKATTGQMRWQSFSMPFRATKKRTTLTIRDVTESLYPGGLVLDGLVVSPVPSKGKPVMPTDLTARAVSATQIELQWVDRSDNEKEFILYRRSGSGTSERIGSVAANVTRYIDRGVKPITTYSYLVRAWNPDGASVRSNEAATTTGAGP